jgi:hypothetical protein
MESDAARLDQMKKSALVLGGANNLHEDMAEALKLFKPAVLIATNNAGRDHQGPLDHWCSMHPDKLGNWVKERRKAGRPDAGTLWRPRHRPTPQGLDMQAVPSWGGSSGLLAVTVALLALECDKVVLVGVPLERERAHYDDKRVWVEADRYRSAWQRYLHAMSNKVKSMSGWTRQLLGAPDVEWFNA